MATTPRRRGSACLVLRGGGFALIRRAAHDGAFETRASGTFGPSDPLDGQIETIASVLRAEGVRGERVTLVLCDVWSRTQLVAIPDAPTDVARQILANQVGSGEVFCALEVGQVREGNATLAAHLAMSASDADLGVVIRALRPCGVTVDRVLMMDGALLHFGRATLAQPSSGLRIVAVVEPAWLHLACYDGGRPVFIRHVETLPDLPADTRAAGVVAEVQRTVLVVRGRLKSPELEGVVVVDPMDLVDRQGVEDAGAQIGAAFGFGESATPCGAAPLASGDVIRAAIVAALDPRDARASAVAPSATREGAHRLRVAAAIVFMAACLGGAALFEHERTKAASGAATVAAAVDAGAADVAVIVEEARATVDAFEGAYGGLAAHLAARPRVAPVIAAIAAAVPSQFVLESLSVDRALDEGGSARRAFAVRIDGLVRGTLAERRAEIRTLHDRLLSIKGLSRLAEAPADLTDAAREPDRRDRALTRFAFSFELEIQS